MIDITKKYRTRDGHSVRLISDAGCKQYPIVGLILNGEREDLACWTRNGEFLSGCLNRGDFDLIEVKEPKVLKCWVNFFENSECYSYYSKAMADQYNMCRGYNRIGEAVEVTKVVEE